MFLFRRTALWSGCAILAAGYVAAEEYAARRNVPPTSSADVSSQPTETAAAPVEAAPDFTPLVIDASDVFGPASRRGVPAAKSPRTNVVPGKPAKVRRVQRVTAYCDRGLTAAGVASGVGQCAAPVDIPFGSQVHVPALGRTFVVTDRTDTRFQHNTVDIFIPSEAQCRKFGRRYTPCEITIAKDPPAYGKLRLSKRRE